MLQEFYSTTLISNFIKQLLCTEQLPLVDVVFDDDFLVEGCMYLYNHYIIKCTKTGYLNSSSAETISAEYVIVEHYDREDTKSSFFYTYFSPSSTYDPETHKHLGNYVRFLSSKCSTDLMPYYNCFSSRYLDNVWLRTGVDKDNNSVCNCICEENRDFQVAAVPIKFGKTYTIALDCPDNVLLRCVLYSGNDLIREYPSDPEDHSSERKTYHIYSDELTTSSSMIISTPSKFSKPFKYGPIIPQNGNIQQFKDDLYLLIQIPSSVSTSIVVLEGDYVETNFKPSLLLFNTKVSVPFSDTLVEYLLDNVINSTDSSSQNILNVQEALCNADPYYADRIRRNKATLGVWDPEIKETINRIIKNKLDVSLPDQDGSITRKIEDLLHKVGQYRMRK